MGVLGSQYNPDVSSGEAQKVDWPLVFSILFIIIIGLINLYSATVDPTHSASSFVSKQLIFLSVGFVLVGVSLFFDYRILEHFAYLFYYLNLVLLIGVRFFGEIRNGARSWYNFGVIAYQPSETMKLAMILALAKYFHSKIMNRAMGVKQLLLPSLIVLLPTVLTIVQPDMGTGFHMAITGASVILFLGVRPRLILVVFAAALVSFPILWKYGLQEYQKDRIRVVIDPMRDPQGRGYNAIQSMVAVGSGQIIGKGFRQGTQTQLGFTPEGYTDFIFTVLAEEWGFIGCVFYLLAFLVLVYRVLGIASQAREKFGAILAVGVASMIALQVIVNLSMVVGIFPIVGIPLPLASYGGTSVMTVCLALGLVLNVGYRKNLF